MASVINTNMASLTAQRNLSNAQGAQTDAMQRLSSGLRINSAKDDAAGLAISTRFSSQTQGLAVAIRNSGDGISLAQTAEGALGTMTESLQRVRELALQAANGTNSTSDRKALNAEAQQMIAEISRTAEETNFNGQKLLDGSFKTQFQVGANAGETISVDVANVGIDSLGVSDQAGVSAVGTDNALGNGDLVLNGVNIGSSSASDDDASTFNAGASAIAKAAAINKHTAETNVTAVVDKNTVSGSSQTGLADAKSSTITLNDVEINIDTTNDAATTRAAVAAAINAESDRTGIKAVDSGDSATGVTLEAEDGRNIQLKFGTDLTTGNTGLAAAAAGGDGTTYEGGFTLVAENGAKTIEIDGGNGTGNGSLAHAGLSKGSYTAGVSAVSGSAVTGEASTDATAGSATLNLNSLKGNLYSGSPVDLTINGQAVTINGDLPETETPATASLDLSSVYAGGGKDFSTVNGSLSITVDNGTAVPVSLSGDYRQNVSQVGITALVEADLTGLGATEEISVDGQTISFDGSSLSGLTGAALAAATEGVINSGIAEFNSTAAPGDVLAGVSVGFDGGTDFTIHSNKTEGDGNVTAGASTFNGEAVTTRELKADNAGVAISADTSIGIGATITFTVDGTTETYDNTSGGLETFGGVAAAIATAIGATQTTDTEGNIVFTTGTAGSAGDISVTAVTAEYAVEARLNDSDLATDLDLASITGITSGAETIPGGTDGAFTVVGTTAGSGGSIQIDDSTGVSATGLAAATGPVTGSTSAITDAQLIAAFDPADLLAAGLEFVTDSNDDGNIVIQTTTAGSGNDVDVQNVSTSGVAVIGTATPGQDAQVAQEHNLDAGDLVINNVAIKSAQAADDVASYAGANSSSKTASGISVAAAINKSTGETGVSATVNETEYVGGDTTTKGESGNTGNVFINGVEISLTTQTNEGSNRSHAVDQINAVSGQTGVTATDNGKSLSLTAADGRNISLAFDTNEAAQPGVSPIQSGVKATDFGLGGDAISSSDLSAAADPKAAADLVAETTYSTVSLSGAGDIDVGAGINGSAGLNSLGFTAGSYGGGEDGTFLKDVDLTTVAGANDALTAIDNALDSVNSQRAELGAIQNRFETTVKNLQVNSENLTASNSRIRDADFAAETAELSRARVLQQAGTSILAQANALPNQVLSLLQ